MKCLTEAININSSFNNKLWLNLINAQLGYLYIKKGKYIKAEKNLLDCLEYFQENGFQLKEATTLYFLGMAQFKLGKYGRALEYFNQTLSYFLDTELQIGAVIIYSTLSDYYKELSEFSKARNLLNRALEICKIKGHKYMEPFIYTRLVDLSLELGNFHLAGEYIEESLESIENIVDDTTRRGSYKHIGNLFLSTGKYYRHNGEYSKALEYFLKARDVYEYLGNKERIGESYICLAYLFSRLGDKNKELYYSKKYSNLSEGAKPSEDLVNNLILKAKLHYSSGDKKSSLKDLTAALAISKDLNSIYQEANCLNEIGIYHLSEKEYLCGIQYFEKGLELIKSIEGYDLEYEIFQNIAVGYLYLEDFERAKYYLDQVNETNLELMSKEAVHFYYYLMGRICLELNKAEIALQYLKKSEDIKENVRRSIREREYISNYVDAFPLVYEDLIFILDKKIEQGDYDSLKEEAFKYSERARSQVLLNFLSKRATFTENKEFLEIKKRIKILYARIGRLKQLYSHTSIKEEKDAIFNRVVNLEEQIRQSEFRFEGFFNAFVPGIDTESYTLKNIQDEILKKRDTALLEYYIGERYSFVFVITPDCRKLIRLSRNQSNLLRDIKKLREPFEKIKQGSFIIGELNKYDVKLAHELYKDLISPVITYLNDIKELIIIPHGCGMIKDLHLKKRSDLVLTTGPLKSSLFCDAYIALSAYWALRINSGLLECFALEMALFI